LGSSAELNALENAHFNSHISPPSRQSFEGLAGAAPRRCTSAHHNDECGIMNDEFVSFIHAFIVHPSSFIFTYN
jgi:hypothetical protein